jgi:hypothetical protein
MKRYLTFRFVFTIDVARVLLAFALLSAVL